MKIGTRTFVFTGDHFLIYNEKLEDLMYIMDDENVQEPKNLVVDGLYSVFANYTSFIKHIDEVKRDQHLVNKISSGKMAEFIFDIEQKCNHIYIVFPDILMNSHHNTSGLNEIFKHDFYTFLLEGLDDEEVFERSEMMYELAHVVEDIFVYSIIEKNASSNVHQEVLPIYINQIKDSNGLLSLHIIVFEILEE